MQFKMVDNPSAFGVIDTLYDPGQDGDSIIHKELYPKPVLEHHNRLDTGLGTIHQRRSRPAKFSSCTSPNSNTDYIRQQSSSKATLFTLLFGTIILIQVASSDVISENVNDSDSDSEISHSCDLVKPFLVDENNHLSPLEIQSCPSELRLSIMSSHGKEFVIELVRNRHLISDNYFKMFNEDKTDKLGKKINIKNQISKLDDARHSSDFYHNHHYISLHDFKDNNEHCHYQGLVDGNPNSVAAISIVDSNLLSGVFYQKLDSYHLLAISEVKKTLLVKVNSTNLRANQPDFPGFKELHECLHKSGLASKEMLHDASSILNRSRRDLLTPDNMISQGATRLKIKRKSSQDNKVLHEPYQRNPDSLFVELLIVHDHNQFKEYNGNKTLIAERTMQIVNIMNAFYRQLNIFVALVGVILWTVEDEIKLTEDGDATLTNFLKYRYEKLLPHYHHDNAQLITSTSFNGSVVGKALKGPICTHDHSGGVNTDHSHSPAIVAVTLAHELGHNLGMEHDEDNKCSCPDEKCIMSSSSSYVHPKHWSSCSIDYLNDSRKHGLLDCLINEPEQVFGPICGNGFVEEGEDCDIGEPIPSYGTSKSRNRNERIIGTRSSSVEMGATNNWIRNPCCDRVTCKFATNATCAQGPCCDLTKCAVFNSTEAKVCRPRKNECDFEEVCDGLNEFCPIDVHYHDGIECGPTASANMHSEMPSNSLYAFGSTAYNRTRSYCYEGQCSSHESQCQLLWGTSGSTSRDICYEQNVHGNTSGNCGYNRLDKVYEVCDPDDALCGMLHCVHNQPSSSDASRKTGKLSYGFESASILTVSFFVMSNHDRIYCHGAIVDAGPYMRDPGLVPNGASCGEGKMCLNQKCIPVADVAYKNWCPSDCNGNGICDNLGICHCNDGPIGTSCYQLFGSNFHLSLILYIIMFFGPMIALILLAASHYKKKIEIWWFLHNRKIALRSRKPGHNNHHQQSNAQSRRAMAYQAKGNQVYISEPIPLNNQKFKGIHPPDYSPNNNDPWAETSTSSSGGAQISASTVLVSALITPTHTNDATSAAFGVSQTPGYRLEPLARKLLEPLPPPIPPHQNRQPIFGIADSQNSSITNDETNNMRPVRTAPPPPPPPPHAHQRH